MSLLNLLPPFQKAPVEAAQPSQVPDHASSSAETSQNGIKYIDLSYPDETRLITLHGGSFSSSIKCTLSHIRLDSEPEYDALSYVWGSSEDKEEILLNGAACFVRRNLFNALQNLRLPTADRRLWIDALCINQLNDKERSHQVAQMSDIYSYAKCVRVWLGLADSSTATLFANIRQGHNFQYCTSSVIQEGKQQLIALCSRPYWSRLWIIQEVILATDITIHCGEYSVAWTSFAKVLCSNSEVADELRKSRASKLCRQKEAFTARMLHDLEDNSLFELVEMYFQAQCVDIRDKVYGLHGFALECCREAVPVDYLCTAYELCHRLVKHEAEAHMQQSTTFLKRSQRLHRRIVRGAMEQQTSSSLPFEVGTIKSSPMELLGGKWSTWVDASPCGKVKWVSRPLYEAWDEDAYVDCFSKVPAAMRHISGAYVDKLLTKHIRQRTQLQSPKESKSASDVAAGADKASGMLNEIFDMLSDASDSRLAANRRVQSSQYVMIVANNGYDDFLYHTDRLYHTQAKVNKDDTVFALDNGTLLIIRNESYVLGKAMPIRSVDAPGPRRYDKVWWYMDLATIIDLSYVQPP